MKALVAALAFGLASVSPAGWVVPPSGSPPDPDNAWRKDVRTISASSSGGASLSYRYLLLDAGPGVGLVHPDYEVVLFVNSATNVTALGQYSPYYAPEFPADATRSNLLLEFRSVAGGYSGPPYSFNLLQRYPSGAVFASNLLCTVSVGGSGEGELFHGYRLGPPSTLVVTNATGNMNLVWPYVPPRASTGSFGFAWRYKWQ